MYAPLIDRVVCVRTAIVCILGLYLVYPQFDRSAAAADHSQLAGKLVTVITWDAEFKDNDKSFGEPAFGENLIVQLADGDLLWFKSRTGYLNRSDVVPYEEAVDYLTRKIKEDASATNYVNRALCRLKRGELELAMRDFDESTRRDPHNSAIYFHRGNAWIGEREYDKAIADYTQAIRLEPQHAPAYKNRAYARNEKGEYADAIIDFDEALRLDPEDPLQYGRRGIAWSKKGDAKKALADFNEAIRLAPKEASFRCHRGVYWSSEHKYDKSLADFNEAIRLDLKCGYAFNNRAWLRATCPDAHFRDGEQAVHDALIACDLTDWKNDSYIDTLSVALAETGRFDQAISRLQQAVDINPNSAKETRAAMMKAYRAGKSYHVKSK